MIGFILFLNLLAQQSQVQGQWRTFPCAVGKLHIEQNVSDQNIQLIQSYLERTNQLYQSEWGFKALPSRNVYVYSSTASFQKRTAQKWYVAALWDGFAIHIQNPDALRKRTALEATIIHELAHVHLQSRWGKKIPVWFEEGFAVYSSGEMPSLPRARTFLKSLNDFMTQRRKIKDQSHLRAWYASAGLLVFVMIRQFGKGTIQKMLTGAKPILFEQSIASILKVQYNLFEQNLLEEYNFRVKKRKLPF